MARCSSAEAAKPEKVQTRARLLDHGVRRQMGIKKWFVMRILRVLHGMSVYKNARGCCLKTGRSMLKHFQPSHPKLSS
jgi:hypothetical protein